MAVTPSETYSRALEERRRLVAASQRIATRLAFARLGIALAGAALAWLVLVPRTLSWPWLLIPAAAFAAAARLHDRVLGRQARAERAVRFYERGLARVDDRWAGGGCAGDEYLDPKHPYASDLDLFGRASLFELLSTARTRSGEKTLASWLLSPALPEEVRVRQEAVKELRGRLDLREELCVLGEDVRSGVDTDGLVAWACAPALLEGRWQVGAGAALAVANLTTLGLFFSGVHGLGPFLVSAVVSGVFARVHGKRAAHVLRAVERPAAELRILAETLGRLEREPFRAALLRSLAAPLSGAPTPASRQIASLARLSEWNESRRNQIFAPLAALCLLGTQLAFALERFRARSGASVRHWVEAVGAMESLSSLAAFAFEHPEDPFPEILEAGPVFEARGLGHPLLPAIRCVRNDVRMGHGLQLLMVSGSNMSGKSTLLRSVGVNTVLALAGAPVRARALALSPLQVAACMRVQDSLAEGTSHFYAEIQRLHALTSLGRSSGLPLLFLLDEVLHGTNSHDRRIGAEALVRGLVERGALGLVTTHDLALAAIADELAPRAANVHFEDHLEEDRIVFDYRLKPGVVRKSNALALMRAIGLEI